ncbi:MAG TPA: hypothetical protein VFY13_05890 [Luteolibacter sp.]|nr:hypothetical protein [Luteolibacter sp.]
MATRVLIALNASGCALLIVLLVASWNGERRLKAHLATLENQLAQSNEQLHKQIDRATALSADLDLLKQSLGNAKAALEAADKAQAGHNQQLEQARAQMADATRILQEWRTAVDQRDARIGELEAQLKATRERLDEAIARLKREGR